MAWLDPIDYIQTIPRATMFGALYWTDQRDRILCLRSARNPSIWQLAGGDFDHGDVTPFDTACREGAEETGIAYTGPERVLLVQYLAESTAWPCPKVGFVFDAGQLTDDQLGAIRLDPAEHTEHAVRSLDQWATVLDEGQHDRLARIAEARRTGHTGILISKGAAEYPALPGSSA